MNKTAQRFLVFFLGVPAVVALVLLLPHRNHLALNLVLVAFSSLGAAEFSVMLAQKNLRIPKAEAAVLGALLPAPMVFVGGIPLAAAILALVLAATAGVSWLLLSRLFFGGAKLDGFIGGVVGGIAALLYPGIFVVWIMAMTLLGGENAGIVIMAFLVSVFAGDSLAWASGMLFGKGNRGIVPASPNKSVAGFVGGAIGPVIILVAAVHVWPGVFATDVPVIAGLVTGLLTGGAAILGDLAESALKRSSGVKDSGRSILGRGGVLDSIDSVAMAAPVFFLCFMLFFA